MSNDLDAAMEAAWRARGVLYCTAYAISLSISSAMEECFPSVALQAELGASTSPEDRAKVESLLRRAQKLHYDATQMCIEKAPTDDGDDGRGDL